MLRALSAAADKQVPITHFLHSLSWHWMSSWRHTQQSAIISQLVCAIKWFVLHASHLDAFEHDAFKIHFYRTRFWTPNIVELP